MQHTNDSNVMSIGGSYGAHLYSQEQATCFSVHARRTRIFLSEQECDLVTVLVGMSLQIV